MDGTIRKMDKSVLLKVLEKNVVSYPPKSHDIMDLDGFFILHAMWDDSQWFENIFKKLISIVIP